MSKSKQMINVFREVKRIDEDATQHASTLEGFVFYTGSNNNTINTIDTVHSINNTNTNSDIIISTDPPPLKEEHFRFAEKQNKTNSKDIVLYLVLTLNIILFFIIIYNQIILFNRGEKLFTDMNKSIYNLKDDIQLITENVLEKINNLHTKQIVLIPEMSKPTPIDKTQKTSINKNKKVINKKNNIIISQLNFNSKVQEPELNVTKTEEEFEIIKPINKEENQYKININGDSEKYTAYQEVEYKQQDTDKFLSEPSVLYKARKR